MANKSLERDAKNSTTLKFAKTGRAPHLKPGYKQFMNQIKGTLKRWNEE